MEKLKQLLKQGDDEFANFIRPYVIKYLGRTEIFDTEKMIKIFYVFEVYLSYIIESAQQTDEDNRTIKTALGAMVVNSMFRMQGIGFLSLSESDAIKFEDFFHSKSFLILQLMTEFFVYLNSGNKSFIEFIISTKSEKPKTFSECVCKVLAENWLKNANNTSTQISKNENNEKLKYKNKTVDDFHFFPNPDFALTGPRLKPDEVRQRVNAIEEMQHKAKEQKDEEQFDLFIIALVGLLIAVIALLVIGFTSY